MNYLAAAERFFGDRPGGGYRVAWELAKLVRDLGHRSTLLCGSTGTLSSVEEIEGVRVVRYPFPPIPRLHPLRLRRQEEAAAAALAAHVSGERFDTVHSHMPAPGLAAFARAGDGADRLCTVHSPVALEQEANWKRQGWVGRVKLALGRPTLRHAERRLLMAARRLHCLSRFTRDGLVSEHGAWLRERVEIIPWWREPSARRSMSREEARRRLGWPLGERVILSVRRLVPRMGLDVLIEAAATLLERTATRIEIVGDGPERDSLARLAADRGAGRRVCLRGRLSEPDLALAYQAADLFVVPTLELEGFGVIVLEALGYGCPVIATRCGALPELLEPLPYAALCAPGSVSDLRRRIEDFLDGRMAVPDPSTLEQYVEERFGKSALRGRYVEWLFGGSRFA